MKRRVLLAKTATVAPLSGCLTSNDSGATRLVGLVIQTHSRDPIDIDLRIEWEDELVHDSTYLVEPDTDEDRIVYEGPVPERSWPDEPGQFTLFARISGEGEWTTLDPAEYDYPECIDVDVRVSQGRSVAFLPITEAWVCDSESPNDR